MNLMILKLNFCTKLNHINIILLIIHQKNTGNLEHIITLLLDNIMFLKDQLNKNVMHSLINQLSQQNNNLFQNRSPDNQLETKRKAL